MPRAKPSFWRSLLGTALASLCFISATARAAQAGTLHNGWNYAIDSLSDGVTGGVIGTNGAFEFYGLALHENRDRIFIAINANLPLTGYDAPDVTNGSIAYGDLFFNFSGHSFPIASQNSELFAIRFAGVNDAGVKDMGVYRHVSAKNVTQINSGFSNLQEYSDYVRLYGGIPSMADLAIDDPYFAQAGSWNILNDIASGDWVGDITFLNHTELSLLGLDFGYFNPTGSQTIGFSFDKGLLPSGDFIAHLLAECANDGMALQGQLAQPLVDDVKTVPEPSGMMGMILFGLGLVASQWLKVES
ncbi:MAG TPA: PEP-CTERM sorting domain-containing protein [Cyanobacteria bacterium UBA11149]|nr:PEP-CTERM sorting domain-containing protein [Cyanobacteria bacterium UBA11367]HBE57002.1 PEP-CTERM sorting domain-containing protein [Cyanobacteria bacterium UBA11366]HBS71448.1 PEP-CTERM sorting domain-containing protein [Cyanobacteria bacterium UBA11153]HBW91632.1 PEP-CTERM sorting domain-containing protein [Cyanobacteria bacterium UBA11149]HCA95561.1 PEP-CTERM sorting domain-containing protein [Cyanobacteria bacterium UBA9226]